MRFDIHRARRVAASVMLLTFLAALLAISGQARATCRVFESRGDYLGYAKLYSVESPIFRIKNPYQTLAGSRELNDRKRARSALLREFKATPYEGLSLHEIPPAVMLSAQEKAGIGLLLQTHIADYALSYGSARVREDGSISLIYKFINIRDSSRADRVLIVPAGRAHRLKTVICKRLNCQGEGDGESPILSGPALKTLIGVELASQLNACH